VSDLVETQIRLATLADSEEIAILHAESWRRHYRGAYSDFYLDGDLEADRLRVWKERLGQGDRQTITLVAEDEGSVVGFIHLIIDADPEHGNLIDNLHVCRVLKRRGVGTRLLHASAHILVRDRSASPIFLWVQEQNTDAQAFYESRNGKLAERELIEPPAGNPLNLNGEPSKIRVTWPSPAAVLSPNERPPG